jgi:hypothetical protein
MDLSNIYHICYGVMTMSDLSKKSDFHIPFIKELVFVGLVTIVSMAFTRFLLINYLPTTIQNVLYTLHKF